VTTALASLHSKAEIIEAWMRQTSRRLAEVLVLCAVCSYHSNLRELQKQTNQERRILNGKTAAHLLVLLLVESSF
jgi:hypothetical protein